MVEKTHTGEESYRDSVNRGFYQQHHSGLSGKYDNVRCYWEDQLSRIYLRPFVRQLVESTPNRGLRILDLGCGAGQGYELLTHIPSRDISLSSYHEYVLNAENIDLYLGVDLSTAMVEQGQANYTDREHIRFQTGDLREGLGTAKDEAPFDLYYSSYGSFSHLDYESVRHLLEDIIEHASSGAFIVLDLLGRFSMEWPGYWQASDENDKVREYSMSYLYDEEERKNLDIDRFMLRFWTGQEVHNLCSQISQDNDATLKVAGLHDRSIMVGRHVDTGEYGSFLPPLRRTVNQLHEDYMRTDLDELLVEYEPVAGFQDLNTFFEALCSGWNQVVKFTMHKLGGKRMNLVDIEGWDAFPSPVQMAIMNMDRVVDSVAWTRFGDSRANIIEPQLGYVLRTLVDNMERGWGCGHGLLGILEIDKS